MAADRLGTVSSAPGFASRRASRAVEIRLVAGVAQVGTWDLDSGTRRVVTTHPHGVDLSEIEPDGEFVWWFEADTAGEGAWCRQPFAAADPRPALLGVPAGRARGIGFDHAGRLAAVCVGVAEGSRCFVGPPGGTGTEVYAASGYRCLVDVSPDGTRLAFAGPPDGRDAVVLHDVATGATAALSGDRHRRLWPLEFRPAVGATPELMLMVETPAGFTVATWSPGAEPLGRPHLTFPTTASAGWYNDGQRVLVQHETAGRSRLLFADLDRPAVRELPVPDGTIHDVSCAPDGTVHCLWSREGVAATQLALDPARDDRPPAAWTVAGAASPDLWTPTGYGAIHSFVAPRPGDQPGPVVFLIHGGPATHDRDCADPRVEALRHAGYTVVRTNYRGSTGYGPAWQHDFGGRVGLAQIEDLAAVRDHLVAEGIADERAIALQGYSWGGYLALLAMGAQPDLWCAAVAAYPIADYVRCFMTTTPALRDVDVELFGGTPQQYPDRYAAASPLTYAHQVRGRVLLIGARDDERCPPGQIHSYAEALRAHAVPHQVIWRRGGHAGPRLDEQAWLMSRAIAFLGGTRDTPPIP